MNTAILDQAVLAIGLSHALQPPLTVLLAKRLDLERAFADLPPLAAQIARNMAFASVSLPTSAGLLLALSAHEVVAGGGVRFFAWLMAAFWTWRLSRQLVLGPLLPRAWHLTLTAIFCAQGPLFAALLAWVAHS